MSLSRDGKTAVAAAPTGLAPKAASLSQWQLIRRRFKRHRVAVAALYALVVMYALAALAEFIAPYGANWQHLPRAWAPPQPPRISLEHGLHVLGFRKHVDPVTFQVAYVENPDDVIPLGFFARGQPYRLWNLVEWDCHLLGVDMEAYRALHPEFGDQRPATDAAEGPGAEAAGPPGEGEEAARPEEAPAGPTFYLLGADKYGRDIFSRLVYGARVSLSIGIVAIVVTFLLGVSIGGVSGYVGGAVDNAIQRGIEIVNSFPRLPLWLALGAALPRHWSPLEVYFGITIVLALLGWTGLARVVRGKLLSLREEEYAVAARLIGAGHGRIIFRHLLPGFTSHIIVALTLSVPGMILGETALSFLGLGLRPPVVSWGVMLQDCMNMQVVANYPWLLMPVVFIVTVVLACNFLGDGLRDAADPYSERA
jgi:peptide/nickel transport system permease protein